MSASITQQAYVSTSSSYGLVSGSFSSSPQKGLPEAAVTAEAVKVARLASACFQQFSRPATTVVAHTLQLTLCPVLRVLLVVMLSCWVPVLILDTPQSVLRPMLPMLRGS